MFVNKHPALRLFVCRAPQPALRAPGAQTWEHIGQGARNTADYLERKLTELSAKTASDTEIGEQ